MIVIEAFLYLLLEIFGEFLIEVFGHSASAALARIVEFVMGRPL